MARKLIYNELERTVNELEKDLLAYKSSTEAAVTAKEELALIFNAIPDYIAVVDCQYRIQIANMSLASKLGCPQERLVGEPCYKYICKAECPPSSCPHSQMLNDGKEHLAEIYDRHLEMIQTGSERILLIDDEKFQVNPGRRMLEGFGFAETARTDSIGALKLFRLSKGGHHDQTN